MEKVRFQDGITWWSYLKAARWLWVPALVFGITRLGIAMVAYITVPLLADSTVTPYHYRPENTLLDVFGSRCDTGFYLNIATEGYQYREVSLPSVAFFPLVPLWIRAVTSMMGDRLIAGLIVTNRALLLATILFYRLARLFYLSPGCCNKKNAPFDKVRMRS